MARATRAYGRSERPAAVAEAAGLTPREAEILRLLSAGMSRDAANAAPRTLH